MKLPIYTLTIEDAANGVQTSVFTKREDRDRTVVSWLVLSQEDLDPLGDLFKAKVDRLYADWLAFDNCESMTEELSELRDIRGAYNDWIHIEDHEIEIPEPVTP